MRFILAVASMMIVFAAQNAAAFRAPVARGIVGGSGRSGHLLRANGAIMRSHRHRHYDLRSSTSMAAYSNNANSASVGAATSAINLGNGNIVSLAMNVEMSLSKDFRETLYLFAVNSKVRVYAEPQHIISELDCNFVAFAGVPINCPKMW